MEANAQKFLRQARKDLLHNKVNANDLQHFKVKDIKSRYQIEALEKKVKVHEDRLATATTVSI